MSDRIPPHSLEAEQFVLGSVIVAPAVIDVLTDLREEDFFLPAHRVIWLAMVTLKAKGRTLDVLSVGDELSKIGEDLRLEGGVGYLLKIAGEVPTVSNVEHYARVVRDKSTLRRVIALTAEVQSKAFGGEDVDEVVSQLRTGAIEMETADRSGGGPVVAGSVLAQVLEVIETRARAPKEHAVMTGISAFDLKVGGFRAEHLIVIAGGPGSGKSALAGGVATYNALKGNPALLCSYEMGRQELIERSLSRESKIEGSLIATGKLNYGDWKTVQGAAAKQYEIPLWIEDRTLKLGQLIGTIRRWHDKHVVRAGKKIALVVVDYLGLVPADVSGGNKNREREIATTSAAMKALAKSLKVPVLLLAQLNRDNVKEKRKPRLGDLRESAGPEQDADMVIFPWRLLEHQDEHGSGPAELLVPKHRGGVGNIAVDCWFTAQTMTYEDRPNNGRPYND